MGTHMPHPGQRWCHAAPFSQWKEHRWGLYRFLSRALINSHKDTKRALPAFNAWKRNFQTKERDGPGTPRAMMDFAASASVQKQAPTFIYFFYPLAKRFYCQSTGSRTAHPWRHLPGLQTSRNPSSSGTGTKTRDHTWDGSSFSISCSFHSTDLPPLYRKCFAIYWQEVLLLLLGNSILSLQVFTYWNHPRNSMNKAEPQQLSCNGAKSGKGSEQSYRKGERSSFSTRSFGVTFCFLLKKQNCGRSSFCHLITYRYFKHACLFQEQFYTGISQEHNT